MKTHPDWTLEIVGEGPEEALYRSLINEYELEKEHRAASFHERGAGVYAHSSMYVLSSVGGIRPGDDRGYGARGYLLLHLIYRYARVVERQRYGRSF